MEALRLSEISDDFNQTTRHYIPEDSTLHSYFKSSMTTYVYFWYFCIRLPHAPYLEARSQIGAQGWLLSFLIIHRR
jgi:hypothetical protein